MVAGLLACDRVPLVRCYAEQSAGIAVFMTRGLTLTSALLITLGAGFQINAFLGYFFSKKWGSWDLPAGNAPTHSS